MDAITTSPAPQEPEKVFVGVFINDIQQLDFRANNYIVDFYVWFRWRNPELDPSKSMEFMNRFAPHDNVRDQLYEKPKSMPDGSLYAVIRYQGQFSTKFGLQKYPFDTQGLSVVMEDTVSIYSKQIFVPDGDRPVMLDPVITLPGFTGPPSPPGRRRVPAGRRASRTGLAAACPAPGSGARWRSRRCWS